MFWIFKPKEKRIAEIDAKIVHLQGVKEGRVYSSTARTQENIEREIAALKVKKAALA